MLSVSLKREHAFLPPPHFLSWLNALLAHFASTLYRAFHAARLGEEHGVARSHATHVGHDVGAACLLLYQLHAAPSSFRHAPHGLRLVYLERVVGECRYAIALIVKSRRFKSSARLAVKVTSFG